MHKTKIIKVSTEFSDYLTELKKEFQIKSGFNPSDRELSIFIVKSIKDKPLIKKNEKAIFKI